MNLQSVLVALSLIATVASNAATQDVEAELQQATSELSTTKYELTYDLKKGEQVRYATEHLATVDTKISGNRQQSKMTTKSTKVWNVTEVTENAITFEYEVADVEMFQKEEGRDAVRYNSKTDKEIPIPFQGIAKKIGQRLATITIDRHGNVTKRDRGSGAPDLGFGGPVVPFPPKSIRLKQSWTVPKKLRLRGKDKLVKEVRLQLKYRLEKVQSGVATISIKTEVLTPIDDAALKSQLVQQLSNGSVRFDMDAGRLISKQLDWTESVIGFNGPESNMKYLARFTEKLEEPRVQQQAQKPKPQSKR